MTKLQAVPNRYTGGWLSELDGRTGIAQMMRERWELLTNDLGGADSLSYAQRSLCERGLWLEFWLAQQEQSLATGGEFDSAKWTQGLNSLQGVYSKLGLERRAKDVPDLRDYIAAKKEAAK